MKYRLITAAALAASATFASSTNTVDNTESPDSDTILITATRTRKNVRSIPGNPTVITAEALDRGGFSSVPNTLNKKAGLHVRNYSDNPNRASVDLRGFGENSHGRVLVLVNGKRINRPDLAPVSWAQVPMGNIDRIEVVRGPQSALYGDFAVGGVINIITRRGREKPLTDIGFMAGSHGFNQETISTFGDVEGIGYAVSLEHQSADGYRKRSAYETWSASASLEADPTDWLGSWIDYSYVDSEYELPGSLNAAQLQQNRRQALNPDDDAEDRFHNINTGLGLYPNEHHEATIDLGFSRKDIESNMASWFSFNTWSIDTYSLSPKYVFSAAPAGMDNDLTFGLDVTYDDLDINLYGDRGHTTRNGSSNVEKETTGAFIHNELHLRENLILSAGARAEKSRYSIEERDGTGTLLQDTSETHEVEAYNAGITYLPIDRLKLFARFDKLYRLPFLDEQIFYQGFGSGFSKDLKPETGKSYELGFDLAATDTLALQCTLFHMDMEDEIAYAVTNFVTYEGANFNMDETVHRGIELAGNWQAFEQLGLHANYTFQEVEFSSGANEGNSVPLVPQNLLTAGFDAALLDNLHFMADVTFTDKQFAGGAADNSAGTELDDYTLVDIALRYSHAFEKIETELFAGIDNLFDEEYTPMAYGGFGSIYAYYPAPERTYKAGINVRF